MLEDQAPLIPLALWALNLSERSGRPDLVVLSQAGLGLALTAAGRQRLARPWTPGCPGPLRSGPGPGSTGSWTRWSCSAASAAT